LDISFIRQIDVCSTKLEIEGRRKKNMGKERKTDVDLGGGEKNWSCSVKPVGNILQLRSLEQVEARSEKDSIQIYVTVRILSL
jgi:hypothetical protein